MATLSLACNTYLSQPSMAHCIAPGLTPSFDIEKQFCKQLHPDMMALAWSCSERETFGNASTQIFAIIKLSSTKQQRVLSKEEKFLQRFGLSYAINIASHLIKEIFGEDVKFEVEFKSEHGVEWIDVNIKLHAANSEEIENFLEKTELIEKMFDAEVGHGFLGLINFFPDIR